MEAHQDGSEKLATVGRTENIQIIKVKLPTNEIALGTWNVRTLCATGKLKELTHEMKRYKWNVLGLCEGRWLNFGEVTTDEAHRYDVQRRAR